MGRCLEPNPSNHQVNYSHTVDSFATYRNGNFQKSEKKGEISVYTVINLSLVLFVSTSLGKKIVQNKYLNVTVEVAGV